MDAIDLAQKMLIARITAYCTSNPRGMLAPDIAAIWFQECWAAAKAVVSAKID